VDNVTSSTLLPPSGQSQASKKGSSCILKLKACWTSTSDHHNHNSHHNHNHNQGAGGGTGGLPKTLIVNVVGFTSADDPDEAAAATESNNSGGGSNGGSSSINSNKRLPNLHVEVANTSTGQVS
jgi:hypothetical protein